MNELLTEMKKYTDECKERVKDLDFEQIKALEERFDVIIMKGIEENLPPLNPEKKGTKGASPKTKARNLLDRFIEHKEMILRFLTDLNVPFENNQAERYRNDEAAAKNIRNFQKYKRSGSFLQD